LKLPEVVIYELPQPLLSMQKGKIQAKGLLGLEIQDDV